MELVAGSVKEAKAQGYPEGVCPARGKEVVERKEAKQGQNKVLPRMRDIVGQSGTKRDGRLHPGREIEDHPHPAECRKQEEGSSGEAVHRRVAFAKEIRAR